MLPSQRVHHSHLWSMHSQQWTCNPNHFLHLLHHLIIKMTTPCKLHCPYQLHGKEYPLAPPDVLLDVSLHHLALVVVAMTFTCLPSSFRSSLTSLASSSSIRNIRTASQRSVKHLGFRTGHTLFNSTEQTSTHVASTLPIYSNIITSTYNTVATSVRPIKSACWAQKVTLATRQ